MLCIIRHVYTYLIYCVRNYVVIDRYCPAYLEVPNQNKVMGLTSNTGLLASVQEKYIFPRPKVGKDIPTHNTITYFLLTI